MTTGRFSEIFVGGHWVRSSEQSMIGVVNPATEEIIAEVPAGSVSDANLAVEAARLAFRSWSTTDVEVRRAFVTKLGEALAPRAEELATTISAEMGIPLHQSLGEQVARPIANFGVYSEVAATFPWQEAIGSAVVVRAPVGVVAAITPWNFPLAQVIDKIAPAMLAGCPVILKPSEVAPLSAWAIAEAAEQIDLPAGVFNLVSGYGPTVGEALVTHPSVDMVSFTGSTRAGKRIASLAADRVMRIALEMGGKSANIILDDADLDVALPKSVDACFFNSGQVCDAWTRMLVPRARYQEVVLRVQTLAEATTVGDPLTNVQMGPLVSEVQRDQVRAYIERGIAEGARLVAGGPSAPEGLEKGFYAQPTVFADVDNSMTIAQEEIFGPVLSIIAYDDESEAVRIANDSSYGLSGAVWSTDLERASRIARQLRTGTVKVNGGGRSRGAPFGGFKESGLGREKGRFGLEEFVELQTISLP